MLYQFSGKVLRLGNSIWDFLGVNYLVKGFFEVLIFSPFDHPRHLKSEVLPLAQGAPSAGIVVGYCKNNSALIFHPKLYLQ